MEFVWDYSKPLAMLFCVLLSNSVPLINLEFLKQMFFQWAWRNLFNRDDTLACSEPNTVGTFLSILKGEQPKGA